MADFCCVEGKLIIELDGEQHAVEKARDERRTAFLVGRGFRVIRFGNQAVPRELDRVIKEISISLKDPHRLTQ